MCEPATTLGSKSGGRLSRDHVPSANSRPRRVAAAIARSITASRPSGLISTPSAAAVVPPGEVTFWRKVAASSAERCRSSPAPATVARASRADRSAGRPAAALSVLMAEDGLQQLMIRAIAAATARSKELAK